MELFAKPYAELSLDELYEILRVRAEVFVVEQQCFYLDPDGVDRVAIHVGIRGDAGALVAYARMFPEEGEGGVWHVGRVLAVRRGGGLGRRVMEEVERVAALRGAKLLRMEAQRQAAGFYARLGWRETGPDFDEAGIPHVRMEKQGRRVMNIRLEQPSDYREVENLVRESFWNVYRPGALEHYVLHRLRDDPAFFLCKELRPGYLDGVNGKYATPQGYFVCQQEPDAFAAFDATFPPKKKQKLPGQLFES